MQAMPQIIKCRWPRHFIDPGDHELAFLGVEEIGDGVNLGLVARETIDAGILGEPRAHQLSRARQGGTIRVGGIGKGIGLQGWFGHRG